MDKEATKPKAKEDTDGPEEVPLEDSPSLPEENLLKKLKKKRRTGQKSFRSRTDSPSLPEAWAEENLLKSVKLCPRKQTTDRPWKEVY